MFPITIHKVLYYTCLQSSNVSVSMLHKCDALTGNSSQLRVHQLYTLNIRLTVLIKYAPEVRKPHHMTKQRICFPFHSRLPACQSLLAKRFVTFTVLTVSQEGLCFILCSYVDISNNNMDTWICSYSNVSCILYWRECHLKRSVSV